MLRTKKYYGMYFISIVLLGVIVNAAPFISGNLANPVRWGSKGVRTAIIMDPAYLRVLDYIHALPSDGKFSRFHLRTGELKWFTDSIMQPMSVHQRFLILQENRIFQDTK